MNVEFRQEVQKTLDMSEVKKLAVKMIAGYGPNITGGFYGSFFTGYDQKRETSASSCC